MGAVLPIAALAMQVVGGVAQGVGANSEARAAAAADDQNALLSQQAGEQDAYDIARDERQMSGEALALMGAGHVQLGTGSARDILADSAFQRERDIRVRRARAAGEAADYRRAAKDKRKAGHNALVGSVFGAAATALKGASDLRSNRIQSDQAARERRTRIGGYGSGYPATGSGRVINN